MQLGIYSYKMKIHKETEIGIVFLNYTIVYKRVEGMLNTSHKATQHVMASNLFTLKLK